MNSIPVKAIVGEITEKAQMLLDIEATEAERLKKTEDDLIHWRENYYSVVKKEQDTNEKLKEAELKLSNAEEDSALWKRDFYLMKAKWHKAENQVLLLEKRDDKELTDLDNKNTTLEKEVAELVDKVYILRKDKKRLLQEKAAAHVQESSMQDKYKNLVSELVEATIRGDLNPTKELRDFLLVNVVYSVDQ